ncbi:hypothetical protein U1Q18_027966, partial [Sarracenia purpurea var. burkii]
RDPLEVYNSDGGRSGVWMGSVSTARSVIRIRAGSSRVSPDDNEGHQNGRR